MATPAVRTITIVPKRHVVSEERAARAIIEWVDGSGQRRPIAKTLKPGDKVSWESSGGASDGKVVRKLTSATRIKGHVAKPTPEDTQYLVKSDKSGGEAAHKPEALRRR